MTARFAAACLPSGMVGGMPAVALQMLAASVPGRSVLLPALTREWPSGTVQGIPCRGQFETTLMSGGPQQVLVETPGGIAALAAQRDNASVRETGQPQSFEAILPNGEPIALKVDWNTEGAFGRR